MQGKLTCCGCAVAAYGIWYWVELGWLLQVRLKTRIFQEIEINLKSWNRSGSIPPSQVCGAAGVASFLFLDKKVCVGSFAASAFGGVLLTRIFFSFVVLGSDGVTFCPVGAWNALFYDRGHGFTAFVVTVIWRLSLLSQDFLMGGISFEAGGFQVLTAMDTSLRTFFWASYGPEGTERFGHCGGQDTFCLRQDEKSTFPVFLWSVDGRTKVIEVDKWEKVSKVKQRIAERMEVLSDHFCLVMNSRLLLEDFLIAESGICRYVQIHACG